MKHVLTILIISFSFSLNAQLKQNLGNISSISELDEYKKAFNNPDLKKIKKSIDSRQNCFKLLDSIHTFRIDEQAGNELIGKQFNIYDDRFNLIQKDQYSQSKDLVIGRINYKYDSSNDLISENHLKRDFESEPFIITKSYHHVYNENHDLISTSLFDNNAYSTHQISRYFYTGEQLDSLHIYFSDENWESVKLCKSVIYTFENELKLKSNEIRFNESTGNWSFKVDSEFFYNTDGKLILHNSIEINAPGTSIKETNYEFEYDLFGNLILRTSRSPSNSGGLQKYHYDYNENNDLIEFCKDVEVFGNFGGSVF